MELRLLILQADLMTSKNLSELKTQKLMSPAKEATDS
jgi:hypothetical protein